MAQTLFAQAAANHFVIVHAATPFAVNLSAVGSGLNATTYQLTNAAILAAAPGNVLADGDYPLSFRTGTAGAAATTDTIVGTGFLYWRSNEQLDVDNLVADNIDATISSAGGGAVSADTIDDSRTWNCVGYRATNIVEVYQGFVGTLALKPDINPGTVINTVSAVTIEGDESIDADDLAVNRSKTKAHFTVPALTTSGMYAVTVEVETVDGQTITSTGTLIVR